MKSLMEVLGADSDSAASSGAGDRDRGSFDPDVEGNANDTSPDQNEAIESLAQDCFSALKDGDQEGFAENLIAIIEMVR